MEIHAFTNVQKAYGIYYSLIHTMWAAYDPQAHPSHKEVFEKEKQWLLDIIASMTIEEREDFKTKMVIHKPLLPYIAKALE